MKGTTYWAWYEKASGLFRHIYTRRFMVEMCSPDGFKQAMQRGEGKIVEVQIQEIMEGAK